ncbi:ATP binding protein [Aureococcus anophagefferens]|nr:ATP binding protein [Aureococcus anophagefferens]
MDTVRALKIKELKALIERAGLEHADCLDKDALVERAATAVARLGACKQAQDAASGALLVLADTGAGDDDDFERVLWHCGPASLKTHQPEAARLCAGLPRGWPRDDLGGDLEGVLRAAPPFVGRGVLLADVMGLGKTVECLAGAYRSAAGKAKRGEKNTLLHKGETEADCVRRLVAGFFFGGGRSSAVVKAEAAKAEGAARRVACSSTTVIIDEAHFLRNATSKWGIGAALLGHSSKFCVSATGTPYNNGPQDMAALVSFFDARQDAATKAWWVDACATHESPAKTAAVQKAVATWRPRGLLRRDKSVLSEQLPPRVVRSLPVTPSLAELYCYVPLQAAFFDVLSKFARLAEQGLEKREKIKLFKLLLSIMTLMRMATVHSVLPRNGRELTKLFSKSRRRAKRLACWKADQCVMGDGPLYCAEVHGGFRASAKLVAAVAAVRKAVARGEAVVFWTFYKGVSDLAEAMLDAHGVSSLRFDGDVRADERGAVLDDFRAGGADVLLATVHEQAVDRCHRIGQTKPVAAAFYDAALTIDDCMRHVNDIKLDNATVCLADGTGIGVANTASIYGLDFSFIMNGVN